MVVPSSRSSRLLRTLRKTFSSKKSLKEMKESEEVVVIDEGNRGYSLEEKFYACVDIIQALPKKGPVQVTYMEMLTMYGLFKQVTEGPCNKRQPGFWNPIERAKWESWMRTGDLPREQAMERYVNTVLEKIDFCAEHWDWDEMLRKHADVYDTLQPVLREKFRIIEREYIKEDGTQIKPPPRTPNNSVPTFQAGSNDDLLTVEIPEDTPRPCTTTLETILTPNDPLSDAEYCDARDDRSLSRSSSFSLNDPSPLSADRVRSLRAYCARMDVELRTITATLNALTEAMEARHNSIMKMIKNSAVYVAVPSILSWRSLFFFLIWPFIVHWALRWFGHTALE